VKRKVAEANGNRKAVEKEMYGFGSSSNGDDERSNNETDEEEL
jgi:hypothetical protein